MNYYAGIDVSLKESSVCVVDAAGKVACEVKVRGGLGNLNSGISGFSALRRP